MSANTVELSNVTKIYGARSAGREDIYAVRDINLSIASGEFFTLLGPSGCGKTTTLRLIAGFERPTEGQVTIQGQPMSTVPPYRRPVNTVFQNYALFPHMNVAQNVGYGLSVKRVPRAEREQRVSQALALVQLQEMGERRPSQLSGGQQQRVALARALINQPAVLLLDEPLGALDLKLRKAMQLELKQLQEQVGITFVYVTHDQEEALTMSDRIAVMNAGRILQVGDPVTLYEKPATSFVADFIGESNFISAVVDAIAGNRVSLRAGESHFEADLENEQLQQGQEVTFTIRPEKMSIQSDASTSAGGLQGRVSEVVYIGTDTRYIVALETGADVVVRQQNRSAPDARGPRKGDRVRVQWQMEDGRVLVE